MDGGVGHTAWAPEGREGRSQAGPKGRQLEVGSRRGPRLLVLLYWMNGSSATFWGRKHCWQSFAVLKTFHTLGLCNLSSIHTKAAIHKLKRFTEQSKRALLVSPLIHCLIFYSYYSTENICQHQLTLCLDGSNCQIVFLVCNFIVKFMLNLNVISLLALFLWSISLVGVCRTRIVLPLKCFGTIRVTRYYRGH